MSKVAVMTDTIASVPQEKAKEYGIKVIPFHVVMDGKSYLETTIDKNQFYTRLKQKENLPTTSAPSLGEFLEAYQELSRRAEAILHISMTSSFTMAYGTAIEAKEIAQEKLPKTAIGIVDSKIVESAELLIVIEAARAARQGKNLNEVIQIVNNMIPRINQLSTRDTLFYLDRLGRIFEAKSWAEAESKTGFRAIVEIDAPTGGVTKPVARAKTKKQIMEKMADIAKERIGNKKLHAAIVHTNVPEEAEQLKEMLLSQCHCDGLYINEAAPATAFHNGEGLISFGFYGSD